MKKFKNFLYGAVALFLISSARAETPETIQLRMEVSPQKITIGDIVKVDITVTVSSTVVPAPFQPTTPLGEFEVRNSLSTPLKPLDNGKVTLTHSLLLTTFSTGTQAIPALTLTFQSADGSVSEAKTEELKIEVRSLLQEKGDEGNLRPLKGFFNFKSYLWLWILLGFLAMGGLVYWGIKYRHKKLGIIGGPKMPLQKPEEWAWQQLHKIEDSDLIEAGKIKEYYSELSFVLRGYLERRYGMSALDRTTAELLSDIRKMNLTGQVFNSVRDFLESGDLVKFAKYAPAADEIEKDLIRVKETVTWTTPAVAEEIKVEKEDKIPV